MAHKTGWLGTGVTLVRLTRLRAVRGAGVLLLITGMLIWWLAPTGQDRYPQRPLSFATGVRTGVYERYATMLKPDLQHDLPGVRVKLTPSAGSVENIQLVASGQADLTMAAADAVDDYRGPGRAGLRACARLYDDYVQLVVPATSTVRNAKQLSGLRVAVGQQGSGVELLAIRLLRAAGLDPARDIVAQHIGIDQAPAKLRDGDIDAFFWSGGLPTAAVTSLAENFPVRLVPLGDLVEPLRALRSGSGGHLSFYRQAVVPPDAYPAMNTSGRAVSTIAVANLLVTTERANSDLMERVTRTVIDSRDRIGRQVHAAQLVDLRTAIYTDPLPLHEGARRYYRALKP